MAAICFSYQQGIIIFGMLCVMLGIQVVKIVQAIEKYIEKKEGGEG